MVRPHITPAKGDIAVAVDGQAFTGYMQHVVKSDGQWALDGLGVIEA